MTTEKAVLLALLVVSLHQNFGRGKWQGLRDGLECPPWFLPKNGSCVCGDTLNGKIYCSSEDANLAISSLSCMTFDKELNTTVFGRCIYNPVSPIPISYYPLPVILNTSAFNEQMCGPSNRQGRLCSQCKQGHVLKYPFVSPFGCSKCTNTYSGWIMFFLISTAPTTVIYFIVLALNVDINRPPIVSFVAFNQVLYAMNKYLPTPPPSPAPVIVKLVRSIYGLLSLHYFDEFLPPLCLLGIQNTLVLIVLQYVIGVYPLCLVVVTYVCIELHARNCRLFVILWRPFGWCFSRLRGTWQLQNSVLNALATMLTLSYVELFLNVQFALFGLEIYTPTGRKLKSVYSYYNPYVKYFHGEHAAIALPTLIIALVFLLPVLILMFYPFNWFQRLLDLLKLRRHGLHAFVDIFQGHFKNGSENSRDWRSFSAFYFILRIGVYVSFYTVNPLGALCFPLTFIALLCVTRPYQKQAYNSIECVVFVYYTLFIYVLTQYMIFPPHLFGTFTLTFVYVLYTFPGVCLIVYLVSLAVKTCHWTTIFCSQCRQNGGLTNLLH